MNDQAPAANDDSLLRRIQLGDHSAASEVFQRHAPRLMMVASKRLSDLLRSRMDPEDIVQSTFKSFFRKAAKGGYVAPKAGDLFNLLIVIAMRKINAKADFHQAAGRDIRRTSSTSADGMLEIAERHEQAALHELCVTVAELLEDYNETQQLIIKLRLEGHTIEEIAELAGRSKRTVERELQAFRQRLAKEFAP